MAVEMLNYADLGARLKVSPEAARALAKRLRLPRSRGNDGKVLISVDIELEAMAGGHRADFEWERDQKHKLMAEFLKMIAITMTAKEATARLEGELAALKARPWWRRLAG